MVLSNQVMKGSANILLLRLVNNLDVRHHSGYFPSVVS